MNKVSISDKIKREVKYTNRDFGDFRRHKARNPRPGLDVPRFRATRTLPASWWVTLYLGLF